MLDINQSMALVIRKLTSSDERSQMEDPYKCGPNVIVESRLGPNNYQADTCEWISAE
jgi:hypothetical protein